MKPLEKTIRELIDGKNTVKGYKPFHIPYYQREYVWEGKNRKNNGRNFDKFIMDIANEYFDKGDSSSYFVGNIAFCKTDITEVVDGQQRITTLVLFLSILADNFCTISKRAEHQKLVYNGKQEDMNFIIQESDYLTKELVGSLGYNPEGYTGTGKRIELDKTIARAIEFIKRHYGSKSQAEFDGLYNYILDKVSVILLEYNNQKDALRYFLNINSLSIELSPEEIFLTIFSQALNISRSTKTIYEVKNVLESITNNYDKIKLNDILKIFLTAYYKDDKDMNSNELDALNVGKWLSYYHIDVYSDQLIAQDFCVAFLQYLTDLEEILKYLQGRHASLVKTSPLYLSFALLKYEGYSDLVEVLTALFKQRNNYKTTNIYISGKKELDILKLEDIAKRLNLTLINNYLRNANKRVTGFIENIEFDNKTKIEKLSLNDIVTNSKTNIQQVFSLTYMTHPQSDPKPNIKDLSRIIKVILSLQQGYLSFIGDGKDSLYRYIESCLTGNFTIEHLYSKNEYAQPLRLNNWKTLKNKFISPAEFDIDRSNFENLSLLNASANSSASDNNIYDKFVKYNNAHNILSTGNEYLIQSLVDESHYYENQNIMALGLPERKITNINQNTWEHSSNNRAFTIKLLELVLEELK